MCKTEANHSGGRGVGEREEERGGRGEGGGGREGGRGKGRLGVEW